MKRILCLCTLLTLMASSAFAQVRNTTGDDFWVAFMDAEDSAMGDLSYCLFATSSISCSMTATNPNTSWSSTVNVSPNTICRLWVPLSEAHTTSSGEMVNKGIHVTSTADISLYAMTRGNPSMDFTYILPTRLLRDDYMVQTYPPDRYSSEFAIVAVLDSTVVDINMLGNAEGFEDGQSYTLTIPKAGQMCQIRGINLDDLSGTRIHARDGKRIAVFNGNSCVYVPDGSRLFSCDHVVEQATPTYYWGKHFVVVGSNTSLCDYVRITSKENNCEVRINDSLQTVLNSGQTWEYKMSAPSAVDEIVTSKPAMTYVYFASRNAVFHGDPSMTTIPPLEQAIERISFPTVTEGHIIHHYLTVVAKMSSASSITIDGVSHANDFSPLPNNSDYGYAQMSINSGKHTIIDYSQEGFIAYTYGTGVRESYGYTVGIAAKNLTEPILHVNGEYTEDCTQSCVGDSVEIAVVEPGGRVERTEWQLADGSPLGETNPLRHAFAEPGQYDLVVNVEYISDTIENLLKYDTLSTCIVVHPTYLFDVHDTVAEPNLPHFHEGNTYNEAVEGDLIQHYTIVDHCDSIESYHLFVWQNDSMSYDTTICDFALPLEWHGARFDMDNLYARLSFTNIHGADSIENLFVNVKTCNAGDVSIWVPNVFTPSLETNNRFAPKCYNILEAKVLIYNRWGMFLTEFDGLTEWWDGTKDGAPCKQDAYVYLIIYRTLAEPDALQKKFGAITLLR